RKGARTSSMRCGAARWRWRQHAGGRRVGARLLPASPHGARVPGAVLHHARRRRGGRGGHRAHGARPVHRSAPPGVPRAAMNGPGLAAPESGALAALLRALGPPLDYLAAHGFRRLETTRLPLAALRGLTAAAAAERPGVPALAELEAILRALEAAPAAERAALFRRAHALVPVLRGAAEAPAPWGEYRATTGPVEPALAALARPAQ